MHPALAAELAALETLVNQAAETPEGAPAKLAILPNLGKLKTAYEIINSLAKLRTLTSDPTTPEGLAERFTIVLEAADAAATLTETTVDDKAVDTLQALASDPDTLVVLAVVLKKLKPLLDKKLAGEVTESEFKFLVAQTLKEDLPATA